MLVKNLQYFRNKVVSRIEHLLTEKQSRLSGMSEAVSFNFARKKSPTLAGIEQVVGDDSANYSNVNEGYILLTIDPRTFD